MAEAFIVEALGTAGGRWSGRLDGWHPALTWPGRC